MRGHRGHVSMPPEAIAGPTHPEPPVQVSLSPGDSAIPADATSLRPAAVSRVARPLVPALIVFALGLPVCARLVFVGYGPQETSTDHWLHIKLALGMIREPKP